MARQEIDNTRKWMISLYSMVLFFLIANPLTYRVVNQLLGGIIGTISNQKGCPTTLGLVVHSIVFLLITRLSMN